ncbi:MAG: DUF371 domain-containing protein, partial [Halobaculum sp.]
MTDTASSDAAWTADAVTERVVARGHENVSATHRSTFEVTTDDWLTPAGDCILGVEADRAPADFGDRFVERAQAGARITVELLVGRPDESATAVDRDGAAHRLTAVGRGDPTLTFENGRSLVCRTSDYTDDRTAVVEADAAAADFDRAAVGALADGAPLVCL